MITKSSINSMPKLFFKPQNPIESKTKQNKL